MLVESGGDNTVRIKTGMANTLLCRLPFFDEALVLGSAEYEDDSDGED